MAHEWEPVELLDGNALYQGRTATTRTMSLLVTIALPQVNRYAYGPVGRLVTPRHYPRVEETILEGMVWACDNDGYSGFDEGRFMAMLETVSEANEAAARFVPGGECKFVTAPDVVAEAEPTLELFDEWEPVIRSAGVPVALVAQDGLEDLEVPWERVDALFIGGSTEWKLGPEARALTLEAKTLGKWVHMGRVNSYKRMTYAYEIGCDSVDGTKYARFRDTHLPGAVDHLRNLRSETRMISLDKLEELAA